MARTMNSAWLAWYLHGRKGTIMDALPNEKAPTQRLCGAIQDFLVLTLEEEVGADYLFKSST